MNDLKGIIEDCNKSDLVSDKVIKKIIEIIGQEEWQDLHDENSDICTTMGELIITLDRITDLEKENAELKKRNAELRGMYVHSAREAGTYKQFLEAKEKENAELKEQCSILADCNTCTSTCKTENIEMKRQLTKVKEIIKDLMCFIGGAVALHDRKRNKDIDVEKLKAEAEQFLNSEVEK